MKTIDTLYLIDDDDTYQFIIEKTLNSLNLVNSIKIFSNGKAAIDFLEATIHDIDQIPDVILLDLTMPIMDGWQFLEQYLRFRPRIGKKVVIYVISSSIDPRDMQRAKSISEVTDYIVKPLTKTKLISMLHESLKS
ncbi:response regulator [Allomuricauda taeanensis]|uniref:response regulator n=1 Tax=Flagellimonas taeanensis TaxID=1005926 RepID=UPI002E7BC3B0|nr:response regulator [Allomuricauda taeanensis]MEE1963135.1 response regulator [Allomuricauda taeanensis]